MQLRDAFRQLERRGRALVHRDQMPGRARRHLRLRPRPEEDRVRPDANAQQRLIFAMVANVVELEVPVDVLGRRLDLERNALDSDVLWRRQRPLPASARGKLNGESNLVAQPLDELLPDGTHLGVGDSLDVLERRAHPFVIVRLTHENVAQYIERITHRQIPHQ